MQGHTTQLLHTTLENSLAPHSEQLQKISEKSYKTNIMFPRKSYHYYLTQEDNPRHDIKEKSKA